MLQPLSARCLCQDQHSDYVVFWIIFYLFICVVVNYNLFANFFVNSHDFFRLFSIILFRCLYRFFYARQLMNLSKDKFVLKKINTRTQYKYENFSKKNPRQKSILTKLADCNFDVNENINDYHTDIGIRKSRKKQYMNIYIFLKKIWIKHIHTLLCGEDVHEECCRISDCVNL